MVATYQRVSKNLIYLRMIAVPVISILEKEFNTTTMALGNSTLDPIVLVSHLSPSSTMKDIQLIDAAAMHHATTNDEIDGSCFRFLRCPDTLLIKNRLKKNKDKLLHESVDWILHDPRYISWKDGNSISLLWIKGGAGKGKTMMSISLIERLSLAQTESVVVTYFFCQNANYELNTLEAIVKGLILRLVKQQPDLSESLRCRWDAINQRFIEDLTSWQALWDVFLEMLERCKCEKVYIIVDALDECEDNGMADFLKTIVRTGLHQSYKFKWLLTSRPLASAEQELLGGSDQLVLSLELNHKHISEAVQSYITYKMNELDRRHSYGVTLRRQIEIELIEKAEDTYLWASLVCHELEGVCSDKALAIIQSVPLGLHALYYKMVKGVAKGELIMAKIYLRLLKVMMLAYRPLDTREIESMIGPSGLLIDITLFVSQCASLVTMRETTLEFVHQSVRDYLAGDDGRSILDTFESCDHGRIVSTCISHLTERLKVNLAGLPRSDSTRESMKSNTGAENMEYAATFWVQHLEAAKHTKRIQDTLSEHGEVGVFLYTNLLEWLECLSLLGKLPHGVEALKTLKTLMVTPNVSSNPCTCNVVT